MWTQTDEDEIHQRGFPQTRKSQSLGGNAANHSVTTRLLKETGAGSVKKIINLTHIFIVFFKQGGIHTEITTMGDWHHLLFQVWFLGKKWNEYGESKKCLRERS